MAASVAQTNVATRAVRRQDRRHDHHHDWKDEGDRTPSAGVVRV